MIPATRGAAAGAAGEAPVRAERNSLNRVLQYDLPPSMIAINVATLAISQGGCAAAGFAVGAACGGVGAPIGGLIGWVVGAVIGTTAMEHGIRPSYLQAEAYREKVGEEIYEREKQDLLEGINDPEIVCPISGTIIRDPVITEDGVVYDRSFLINWLKKDATCPYTRKPLRLDGIRPDPEALCRINKRLKDECARKLAEDESPSGLLTAILHDSNRTAVDLYKQIDAGWTKEVAAGRIPSKTREEKMNALRALMEADLEAKPK